MKKTFFGIFIMLFAFCPACFAAQTGILTPEAAPVYIEATSTGETIATPEAAVTPETSALKIKGSKSINFVSRSIEGSKEGFVPGLSREESLRLSILGKIDKETDVDANFISTSTSGTTTTTLNEEKVSILVRRASTEAYFGDFIADLNETEFGRLNSSLSGVKLAGNYSDWGFKTLFATPRGQSQYFRSYGDGTQGPYALGTAPVVVDSDRVYLDGVEQKRGDDYTIDYQAGTITFRRSIVLKTSIIEAHYDWRETLYQHYTLGLRLRKNFSEDLRLGFTYLDDSDSLDKARSIMESLSSTIEPQSHRLIDVDGSAKIGNTQIDSEIAYSKKDLNILEPEKHIADGKALKINTSTFQGPFSLLANYKRIGASFQSISDSAPKQDETNYGGALGFHPGNVYFAQADYSYDKYDLLGARYLNTDGNFKSKFTPEDLPSLNYYYRQLEESNDPVTAAKIQRLTTDNNADSSYRFGMLQSNIGAGVEERVSSYPSREVTTYKTVNFGLATYGLDKISASGNIEAKNTLLPDRSDQFTRTYNANVSATPTKDYFGSLSMQIVDDSIDGATDVTDLNYRATPLSNFSTDGKYTITSVKEDFSGTQEGVLKQTGSFKFDLRPNEYFRHRYYFKPSFTWVEGKNSQSFWDYVNQLENWYTPARELSLGLVYNTEGLMNIDRTDPNIKREANRKNSYDTTFLVRSAPLRFLSIELSYLTSDLDLTQQTTAGASAYYKTLGNTKKYDLDARTSLTERYSIDSRFTLQEQYQSGTQASTDMDSRTQTVYLKGLLNYSENWIFFTNFSYSESFNRLTDDITYTDVPGAGVSYILGDKLRIDAEYDRSISYAGNSTEIDTYSLKTKYDPNENVHLNIRGTREIGVEPDYRTSEILGSIEIVL